MSKVLNKNNLIVVSDEDINEYSCGICFEIFVDPLVTHCCRQTYCSDCINKWLEEHNTCPNDRQRLNRNGLSQPPRAFVNLFNNLKIKCDFHSNGCQQILRTNELSNHVLSCDFNPKQICKMCGIVREIDERHDCLENLKFKIDFLSETNRELMNELSKYCKEKEEINIKIQNISEENKELKVKIEKQIIDKLVLLNENKFLIEKNKSLENKISGIEEKYNELKEEKGNSVNFIIN